VTRPHDKTAGSPRAERSDDASRTAASLTFIAALAAAPCSTDRT